jgi:hypothetical protein
LLIALFRDLNDTGLRLLQCLIQGEVVLLPDVIAKEREDG